MITVAHFADLSAGLAAGSPGYGSTCATWGDYDNDGDLDLLIVDYYCRVYRNNGNRTFTHNTSAVLPSLWDGSGAWGDYDNDGDLDILIAGHLASTTTDLSRVYRNNGNGSFTDVGAGLPGVHEAAVGWGDYDNDGALDFVLTGYSYALSANISYLYRNNGNGTFTRNTSAGLPGVAESSVAWGDYDNDGDLDILLAGMLYPFEGIAAVYRNNGDGTFSNIGAALPGVYEGSAAWGDYDHDGDLDILLTGRSGTARVAAVYRNDGSNTFTDIGAGLTGVRERGAGAWGDCDNDGDLDILLTGNSSGGLISRVYRNNGDGTFADIHAGLPGVRLSSAAWGDCDNDGDLDILLLGDSGTADIARVYQNLSAISNIQPGSPSGLRTAASGSEVALRWNAAADSQTPAASLSYNVRVGTTPGGTDIVSPQASGTGLRRLPALGNAQERLSFRLRYPFVAGRPYYWSVQAVDTAWVGSAFAGEETLVLSYAMAGAVPGDSNGDGMVDLTEFGAVRRSYWQSQPPQFGELSGLSQNSVRCTVANCGGGPFTVLVSTNLVDWEELSGAVVPSYQWQDPEATSYPKRFYRLRWP